MPELRIVLADDHEVVRAGLCALVDGEPGLRVVAEASDGLQAVALACKLRPEVVVMDLSMPVLDGARATEQISRECPGVRVIVLTAHDDRAHLNRLMAAGAAGYLVKRTAADELVRAIRVVGAGGSYVDPLLARGLFRSPGGGAALGQATQDGALSDREEEVLRHVAWGESNKEIAARLGISVKTVETYKTRISDKLALRTRADMVRYAVSQGWLTDG